jgi:beta-N-acetylhexosaminidase
MKLFFLLILIFSIVDAQIDDIKLKQEIGRMVIVGFDEKKVDAESQIIKDINNYSLGGVILFDRFYNDRNKTKNISSPKQLKALTSALKALSNKPILIAVDQEGGKVARLKPKYGFKKIPSAKTISQLPIVDAQQFYKQQALMLKQNGINCDFAPVVDVALNPKNKVIVGLERSYSSNPKEVQKYAKIFIDALREQNIISVLKHFPGHGSSLADSHKGFVDITNTWQELELEPYKALIKDGDVDMIMTAHVFNKKLDAQYPATLSYNVNTKLLRKKLGFGGVVVSDDLQMRAITKHYTLKQSLTLAINSGVDMVLFGNQLSHNTPKEIVEAIFEEVKNGNIPYKRIQDANKHIQNLFTKNSIIQKPINFGKKRIALTKEYIKKHYALNVKDIKIKPKMIVLHWTAIMDFDDCFKRLEPQELYSDRKDIVSASALNVSAHFLVDRDGTIYQLMKDNIMARHVIGLNYVSIGVENVGGKDNKEEDLTPAQVRANIKLIRYLKAKYPDIEYLLGHHEYRKLENTKFWMEKDAGYRTTKSDPGVKFMKSVRGEIKDLGLKTP